MLDVKASKVMTSPVVSVRLDTQLREVLRVLHRHYVSGVPVLDEEEKVVGIISERDVLKYTRWVVGRPLRGPGKLLEDKEEAAHVSGERGVDVIEAVAAVTARQVMTMNPFTVREDTPLLNIVRLMNRRAINRVPVVDSEGKLRGIVSRADIMLILEKWAEQA